MWVKAPEKPISVCLKKDFPQPDSQGGTGCLSAATTEKDQVPAENQTGWNLSVPMRNPHGLSHGCEEECEDRTVLFPGWARTMGQQLCGSQTALLDSDVGDLKAKFECHSQQWCSESNGSLSPDEQ